MRWLIRIALTLVFLGLSALAILPYLPAIEQEAKALLAAWKQVRTQEPATPDPIVDDKAPAPRRSLATPDTAPVELAPSEDPFIAETRRRAEQDPEAAMTWLQTQPNGPLRLRGMLEVVALWAAEDSENALLWLESNAQGVARLETLNSGVELWAKQDPQAAATWIEGMANDGSKLSAAKALAGHWAHSQPKEAAQWVASLPNGLLRQEAATALIESWSSSDPEKAAIWALSEAEFNGEIDLLNQSIRHYAEVSPEGAEQFLRGVTEIYDVPSALENYLRARANNAPKQAMDWQSQLTPEDPLNSSENARIIMQEWSLTDSVAASSWLNEQSSSAQRDAAILGFSDSMQGFEPEAAVEWVNTISDSKLRSEQLLLSIRTWAHTQPHEALDWVKTAELEPELRTQLASEIGAD